MTTQVIVKAHCVETKEVVVIIQDSQGRGDAPTILQDEEEKEFLVYDDRMISIQETEK